VKEEDRERAIRLKLVRQEGRRDPGVISTGFAALDSELGVGGLPRGLLTEVFGPSSSGKTTLALQISARVQRGGGTAAWMDADRSFDPAYAAAVGVETQQLPIVQPESAEEALEIAKALVLSGAVDLLTIDSVAALVPQIELESSIGEGGAGIHGRVLASGLRRLAAAVAKTDTVVVLLNQIRSRRERGGTESETTAGGPAPKLYAAVRIGLYPGTGKGVVFRVRKNKLAGAFGEGQLQWRERAGFTETP
jgi:recombination protein RecA